MLTIASEWEYSVRIAVTTAIGFDSPAERRTAASRLFLCVPHGAPYGRAVRGAARLAGSFLRSVNPYGAVHPFDSGRAVLQPFRKESAMPCPTTPHPGEPSLFDRFEKLHEALEKMRAEMACAESLALLEHVSPENNWVTLARDDLAEVFGQWRAALADARKLSLDLHATIHALIGGKSC